MSGILSQAAINVVEARMPGDYAQTLVAARDPRDLAAALATVEGCEPRANDQGDVYPPVNVDVSDTDGTWIVTYPAAVDADLIVTAAAAADAATLTRARAAKAAEIQQVLSDVTDPWVLRAWEDGLTELPTARAAYREQLRELLLQVSTSDDPAAIEIPAAPAWVPPKS